jgi:hypothetical protein
MQQQTAAVVSGAELVAELAERVAEDTTSV